MAFLHHVFLVLFLRDCLIDVSPSLPYGGTQALFTVISPGLSDAAFARSGRLTFRVCGVAVAVCPAGWRPGSSTMKPDPVKSKEYFSTAGK